MLTRFTRSVGVHPHSNALCDKGQIMIDDDYRVCETNKK